MFDSLKLYAHRFFSVLNSNICLALFVFALVIVVYAPGVQDGIFMLDDYRVLPNLEKYGAQKSFKGAVDYVKGTDGGGPLGRPISLLTFYLQANSWNQHPIHFKVVNLFLHAINVCLVYFLVLNLLRFLPFQFYSKKRCLAVVVALLWGVSSIHVSSVLYIVQRMTVLQGTFSLVCILFYLQARQTGIDTGYLKLKAILYILMTALFFALALFSKETAFVTIFFIAAIELMLFDQVRSRFEKIYRSCLLLSPVLLPVLFFLKYDLWMNLYVSLDFNMVERLLTQTRILWHYVFAIIFPWVNDFGLFHDDIEISRSVAEPLTTAFSLLAWMLVIVGAAIFYRKYFVFGLVWFLLGHSLESTLLPLELYFEHRNYLPSIGLLLFIVLVGSAFLDFAKEKSMVLSFFAIFFIIHCISSVAETRLWSDPKEQAIRWAEDRPESFRANRHLARMLFMHNDPEALFALNMVIQKWPADPQSRVDDLRVVCLYGQVYRGSTIELPANETIMIGADTFDNFYSIVDMSTRGQCFNSINHRLIHFANWVLKQHISDYDRDRTKQILEKLTTMVSPNESLESKPSSQRSIEHATPG